MVRDWNHPMYMGLYDFRRCAHFWEAGVGGGWYAVCLKVSRAEFNWPAPLHLLNYCPFNTWNLKIHNAVFNNLFPFQESHSKLTLLLRWTRSPRVLTLENKIPGNQKTWVNMLICRHPSGWKRKPENGKFVGKKSIFYCKINWGLTEEAHSALFLEAAHRLYSFMSFLESWYQKHLINFKMFTKRQFCWTKELGQYTDVYLAVYWPR